MSTSARWGWGLLSLAVLSAGGLWLVRTGLYGWTIFIVLPVLLGGFAVWMFRPATAGRAAATGALAIAGASLAPEMQHATTPLKT